MSGTGAYAVCRNAMRFSAHRRSSRAAGAPFSRALPAPCVIRPTIASRRPAEGISFRP